jgi:PST family polysaccharide transporter
MLRQALGLMISFGGMLLLTRVIGRTDYGVHAGAFVFVAFLNRVGLLGVDVYLIRKEQTLTSAMYNEAFTLLLLCEISLVCVAFLISPLLRDWFSEPRSISPFQALLLALPFSLLGSASRRLKAETPVREKLARLEADG